MNETFSMCGICYRHIPATRLFKDTGVYLSKHCPVHGHQEDLVEIDTEFYKQQLYVKRQPSSYWIDVTNRCNLDCPHCYQMPNNDSTDPSIDYIIDEIKSLPNNGYPLSLVGAEPTTRKDLDILIKKIQELEGKPRTIMIVTNGINLAKYDYAKKFKGIPNLKWTIGLNHPNYNGDSIRQKQEQGIKNCVDLGLVIKNFTYTLGTIDQLPEVLDEVQKWKHENICDNARIQLGVEIGRTPDDHGKELYLSDLVKETKKICEFKNWNFEYSLENSNRTHYAVKINNIIHRLIKWCDVKTIDFEETQSESWASLVPNQPMSTLLHQVILRDRFVNNKLPLYDSIPKKYRNNEINKRNIIYMSPML